MEKDIITKEQKEVINIEKVYKFITSDSQSELEKAKMYRQKHHFI